MTKRSSGSNSSSTYGNNASSFVVFQGYLVGIDRVSKVNSPRSGHYPVKWKDARLPRNVKLGTYVTIVGKLITYNLGQSFVIIDCELLAPKSLRLIKRFIQKQKP